MFWSPGLLPHRFPTPGVPGSPFPPGNPRAEAALPLVPAGFLTIPPSPTQFLQNVLLTFPLLRAMLAPRRSCQDMTLTCSYV